MRNGVAARSRDTTTAPKVERTEILDAAAVCFSKTGFSATSINDIADQLTATKGMVYHHYRSKAELFFDENDNIVALENWKSGLKRYLAYCEQHAIEPKDLTAFN